MARSLVIIDDLSNGEIEGLFNLADEMSAAMSAQFGLCRGKIMASLFFEPSTRTRLSFETAMHRLGGSVITANDVGATSLAKGESIADMAKVVGSYADIIVIRHPWEGAAKVVADYAGVPVINAGDGGHEHPTQTLCDLYTLKKEKKTIKGLKIALWGDLKYGRTVHSLTYALARFGATIHFRSGPGVELPDHVIRKLTTEYKGELRKYGVANQSEKGGVLPIDAIYMTPSSPHQLAMMPDVSLKVEMQEGLDALYVTRLQKERLAKEDAEAGTTYPVVDKKLLREKEFQKTLVMHPLPRVDELARELDADPRSMYFTQAKLGVPMRMALIAFLLGAKHIALPAEAESFKREKELPLYRRDHHLTCPNPRCVSVQATESRYITPEFKIVSAQPVILSCTYCEHELHPRYIASTEWHEGKKETKRYHRADSHWAKQINPEHLIIFQSAEQAEAQGFKPDHSIQEKAEKK